MNPNKKGNSVSRQVSVPSKSKRAIQGFASAVLADFCGRYLPLNTSRYSAYIEIMSLVRWWEHRGG